MSATAAVSATTIAATSATTSTSSSFYYCSLSRRGNIVGYGYNNNGIPGSSRRFGVRCNPTPIFIPSISQRSSSRIVMEWQDCTVKKEIDVPTSVAYKCYSDRQSIPRWMPFISSVKILDDKPDLSRWSLKYQAFGRDIEYSWLARNMQPIPNQKIHWRSLEGLPNRGAVRFYPKGASSCLVELTVSYEVPQLLAPVASALQPFLESLLLGGLERFAKFAKENLSPDATV
ncbi:OLC1v1003644C1 [Oldenlandia corymbosa var. corymbosa]|uniref:OLC1v1003644C1 n=1 Tax=Oldenlandia corymbosa var. corymbosa TaxID=529605 RepID=A0AAV1DAG6_OLDCO|nr:OLC1v1003644C1 [Oldenlandia corymbosa var. corymbosa]